MACCTKCLEYCAKGGCTVDSKEARHEVSAPTDVNIGSSRLSVLAGKPICRPRGQMFPQRREGAKVQGYRFIDSNAWFGFIGEITMGHPFFDLTFTKSVKKAQERYGSRRTYSRFEGGPPDFTGIGDVEADFIEARDGFYMASVNSDGQPYIQFRGGPSGFLKVLDEKTLAFADFRGNMQYISVGNLNENKKAALFLMDYPNQTRLKILANAEVIDAADDPDLITKLAMPDHKAKIERAIVLTVEALDWNCPQHITPRYTMDEVKQIIAPISAHIERLEKELEELKAK